MRRNLAEKVAPHIAQADTRRKVIACGAVRAGACTQPRHPIFVDASEGWRGGHSCAHLLLEDKAARV